MHLSPLCFLALSIAFVSHNVAEGFGIGGPILLPSRMSPAPCRHVDRRWLKTRQHHHHRHRLLGDVILQMTLGDDESERNDKSLLSTVSLGVLPIVWASLATVATTGAGLPPGPFGLLGALEGVSYLLMLTLVGKFVYRSLVRDGDNDGDMVLSSSGILAERLAVFSLALSLLVLASLVVKQGCVPNAKPILDYSAYVPICDASPGLFGE
mmetsp:Transcript_6815/g.11365  ORF Transcript_6815/g.11365 Transcript_6815/m.11365 type:complete len:210 (-) Transcript_6815:1198-1827(-)